MRNHADLFGPEPTTYLPSVRRFEPVPVEERPQRGAAGGNTVGQRHEDRARGQQIRKRATGQDTTSGDGFELRERVGRRGGAGGPLGVEMKDVAFEGRRLLTHVCPSVEHHFDGMDEASPRSGRRAVPTARLTTFDENPGRPNPRRQSVAGVDEVGRARSNPTRRPPEQISIAPNGLPVERFHHRLHERGPPGWIFHEAAGMIVDLQHDVRPPLDAAVIEERLTTRFERVDVDDEPGSKRASERVERPDLGGFEPLVIAIQVRAIRVFAPVPGQTVGVHTRHGGDRKIVWRQPGGGNLLGRLTSDGLVAVLGRDHERATSRVTPSSNDDFEWLSARRDSDRLRDRLDGTRADWRDKHTNALRTNGQPERTRAQNRSDRQTVRTSPQSFRRDAPTMTTDIHPVTTRDPQPQPDRRPKPVAWAWQMVRPHRRLLALTVILRIGWEVSPMLVPTVVGGLVDALTATAADRTAAIATATGALVAIGLFRALAVGAYAEASARLGLAVVTDVRTSVFRALGSAQARPISSGDLLSRAVRDPDRLRSFIDRVFVRSATTIARGLFPAVMLFGSSPLLTLWTLAPLPLQQLGMHFLQRKLQRASRAAADAHAELTDHVQSFLTRRPNEPASPDGAVDETTLARAARKVEATELRSHRLVAGCRAWVWLGTSAGLALLWYHGSHAVDAGTMTVGGLVSFAGYAAFVFRPFRQFTQVLKTYQTGVASLERIAEVLDPRLGRP